MDKKDAVINALREYWRAFENAERVDLVPVVRCKNCKHHHYSVCEIPYCDRIDYGYGWKDEDFCSRGERKDGDHHES